jgi:hypothetical protein
MKGSDISENHQNNCSKVVIALANLLGTGITFYDIKNKEQITARIFFPVFTSSLSTIQNVSTVGSLIY